MARFVYRRILTHLLLLVGLYGLLFSLAAFLDQGVYPSVAFLVIVPGTFLMAVYIHRRGVKKEEFLIQRHERQLLIGTLAADCIIVGILSTYAVWGTTLRTMGLSAVLAPPILAVIVEIVALPFRLAAARRLPRRYPEWVGKRERSGDLTVGAIWLGAALVAVMLGVWDMEWTVWEIEGLEEVGEKDEEAVEGEDPNDPDAIVRRLRAAVEEGDPRAMVELGRIYYDPQHPLYRRDPAAGLHLFQQAAAKNSVEGAALLGIHLYDRARTEEDIAEALNYLRQGIKGRYDGALFRYGEAYEFGRGVERDLKVARANYLLAAERGNINAAYRLGIMARDGVMGEQDYVAAHRWLTAAADGGSSDAANALALLYLLGRGVDSDPEVAAELFERAAEAGNPEAQFNYGVLRYMGESIPRDYGIARKCFEALVANGDPRGAVFLGEMYLYGRGVPVDAAQAEEYFRRAADANLPAGVYQLGVMYLEGRGVPADVNEGIALLRRAANLDLGRAQYVLGMLIVEGKVVRRDPFDAWRWLALATEHNVPGASDALTELSASMSESDLWTARAMVYQFKRERRIERPNPLPVLQ